MKAAALPQATLPEDRQTDFSFEHQLKIDQRNRDGEHV
jgi:hypothetical protein